MLTESFQTQPGPRTCCPGTAGDTEPSKVNGHQRLWTAHSLSASCLSPLWFPTLHTCHGEMDSAFGKHSPPPSSSPEDKPGCGGCTVFHENHLELEKPGTGLSPASVCLWYRVQSMRSCMGLLGLDHS